MLLVILDMTQAWKFGKKKGNGKGKKQSKRGKPPKRGSRKNVRIEKNSNRISGGVYGSHVNMSNRGRKNVQSNHKSKNHGY